jgi:uncharacterized coiled-coil DUF342 family protein
MHQETTILAPVSAGELIDKITILRIKVERITDARKVALARAELNQLSLIADRHVTFTDDIYEFGDELQAVNERLWDIEDEIRKKEHAGEFDEKFIALARAVYINNDERATIKRKLNEALGSQIVEVKQYA